ncbi:MATH domain and coiled-coil domain-containing protein At3g58270-like [Durio zibethinus]|uniref:MATH domain and coiled-coil domain-containing protein At3g58270-like n=1 Tax=Durio zibethinus TaxID=66656 RepID=A0A6P6B3R8_DURZI|nr:MATH domain and coiled-coil domain-containing protein At3g58270-like [Durio zibethinus]
MEDFGPKKQAKAETSNHKIEKIRDCQPKRKQSPDESEKQPEAEASNKPTMVRDDHPMQKRQKQSPDESKQQVGATSNKLKKRGRKPKLTEDERNKNKIARDRIYRKNKNEKYQKLEQENEESKKKETAHLSEINSLTGQLSEARGQLSEYKARADKLEGELSNASKKVNTAKMMNNVQETAAQQLQQHILNEDCQGHDAKTSQFNEPINDNNMSNLDVEMPKDLITFLEEFYGDSVNVNGFKVLKENAPMIQEIFSKHPNIASGLRVHLVTSKNGLMNTLAEVCKIATKEEVTWEEIEFMEKGIVDLELAGFEILWLRLMVKQHREKAESKKTIGSREAH